MKYYLILIILLLGHLLRCNSSSNKEIDEWTNIKNNTAPVVQLTTQFTTPYRQPLSGMGWEDGIHISRDGLDLYCTYMPVDALSWYLDSSSDKVWDFSEYLRGPLYGMDLVINPLL